MLEGVNELAAWPADVTRRLADTVGEPEAVEPLGGMSGSEVYLVRGARDSVVLKVSAGPREARFYTRVAPHLRPAGIPIPDLVWYEHVADRHWLILEHIPTPLPIPHRDSWSPDPRMVAVLARLHALPIDAPPADFRREEWRWTDAMSEAALSFFAPAEARSLAPAVRALQQEAQHLAEEWCWISGDPNPLNWGLRADGGLALFDWELFRRGAPPLDLAILVVGHGDAEKYEQLARCYLDQWRAVTSAPPWPPATLARDIALGKAWTFVALLSHIVVRGGGRVPDRLKEQLAEYVPPWLREIAGL